MKLDRSLALVIGAVVTLVLVIYVPLEIIDKVSAGAMDPLFGGIVIFFALVIGGVIGFFSVGLPILDIISEEDRHEEEVERLEEKIRIYRARQRAMLEELDEIKKTLEEIRDILRKGLVE